MFFMPRTELQHVVSQFNTSSFLTLHRGRHRCISFPHGLFSLQLLISRLSRLAESALTAKLLRLLPWPFAWCCSVSPLPVLMTFPAQWMLTTSAQMTAPARSTRCSSATASRATERCWRWTMARWSNSQSTGCAATQGTTATKSVPPGNCKEAVWLVMPVPSA